MLKKGRPFGSGDNRVVTKRLRLTPEENETLNQRVEESKTSWSQYVRGRLFEMNLRYEIVVDRGFGDEKWGKVASLDAAIMVARDALTDHETKQVVSGVAVILENGVEVKRFADTVDGPGLYRIVEV